MYVGFIALDEVGKYDLKSKLSLEEFIQGYPVEIASTVIAIPPAQASVEERSNPKITPNPQPWSVH